MKTSRLWALCFACSVLGSWHGLKAADQLSLEERVKRLESKINFKYGTPNWITIHGEWELEYVDAEADQAQDSSANSHARFKHDKFLVKPKIQYNDVMSMSGELRFGSSTGSAKMEEYQVHWKGLPWNSWLKVGLDERFSNADGKYFDMANRKTEDTPLIGRAFWEDEQFAIEWGGKTKMDGFVKDLFWVLSYGNGLELSEAQPTENDTYEITHDNDLASDATKNKNQWMVGLGMTMQPSDDYVFDIATWFIDSNLNEDEQQRLQGINGYSQNTVHGFGIQDQSIHPHEFNATQRRAGYRSTHKYKNTTMTYEYANAKDGKLRREGYYVQGSHKFKFNGGLLGDFFTGVEPLIRYGELNVKKLPAQFSDAETWDRRKTTYALLLDVFKKDNLKSKLKLEYYQNEERTGGADGTGDPTDPDNDEFLAQLEMKF